jgi:ubiquinone/menaquinone biosynthesis C-methylase UbiE
MSESPDDIYADFAERYDRFSGPIGEPDPVRLAFFRQLFAQHQVQSVLDCACGTGRDLILFQALGCQVWGTDLSPSMLAQARKNLAGLGLKIPLTLADYRELPEYFPQPFDAVTCLSSSILHMPDDEEVVRAFASIRTVLKENGILVLSQGTSDKQWRAKPRFISAVNLPEFSRLLAIDYHGRGARYHILDLWHSPERSDFAVWSVDYPHMLLQDDYLRLLTESGFHQITVYGSYRFDPYDKKISDWLIAIAQR